MVGFQKAFLASGFVAAACCMGSAGPLGAAAPGFSVTKIPLSGEGRGDYITADAAGNRLYVTHSARVHILDLATLKPVGTVEGLTSAHGVALDGAGHGFVSDGNTNSVVEFDAATGRMIGRIAVGRKPDSILFDKASGKVMAFDGDSEGVSVIDPSTAMVVATIKLPNGPEFSQGDGRGTVWANMEEGNDIAVIDTKAMKLDHVIKLDGCDGPAPLAFDAANRRLFSGCGNKVMTVTDADAGKVVAMVPVGSDPDGIVYDAGTHRVIVANRDGGWTIVSQRDRDHYVVERTLPVDAYAKTVALDPVTHRIFSSTADLVWPKAVPGKKLLPNAKPGTFRVLAVTQPQ